MNIEITSMTSMAELWSSIITEVQQKCTFRALAELLFKL